MFFTFNTGYYKNGLQLQMLRRSIALRYLRSWFLFDATLVSIDMAGAVKKATGAGAFGGDGAGAARAGRVARVSRIVRMLRLMRLAKLRKLMVSLQSVIDVEWLGVAFLVCKNMGFIMVITHCLACLWFFVGKASGHLGWVERRGFDREDYGIQYLASLEWSLAQFTPGRANVSANSITERIIVCFTLAASFIIATCFVGSVTATMGAVWAVNRYKHTQSMMLKRFLFQVGISRELAARVSRYIECVVALRHRLVPIGKVEYLKLLSGPLNVELYTAILQPYLMAHDFFCRYSHTSKTSIRQVCSTALITETFAKTDTVFRRRTQAKSMYFVTRGTLAYRFPRRSAILDRKSGKSQLTVKLDINQWFSEHPLWIPWLHHGHMKGLSDCEIIVLNAGKFWDVTSKAHASSFVVARQEALDFALRVRACLSFGPDNVTDLPVELLSILLSEASASISVIATMNEIRRAEQLEMQLLEFSDSDSEPDDDEGSKEMNS